MRSRIRFPARAFAAPLLVAAAAIVTPLSASAQSIMTTGFEGGFSSADAAAARLLSQAGFGATAPAIAEVRAAGVEGWIDQQMALPASHHLPFLDQIEASGENVYQNVRIEAWYRNALWAPDQLRQRVAYSLSQIFVISDRSALDGSPFSMASYQDLLVDHAFGNYRDLLEAVTLHPSMGLYLSMLGNQKADTGANIRPDENYAREIMQLFSIGLVRLNADGSVFDGVPDSADPASLGVQPVATYDQNSISAFARVFTGWFWYECRNMTEAQPWFWSYCPVLDQANPASGRRRPMEPVEFKHDTEAKTLLSYAGVGGADPIVIAAGGDARSDLAAALDALANHPNVGPFLSKQLIQRLVTSNPSPAYVARIASVFDDDGLGVRGNLGAVVKAILLDTDARAADDPATAAADDFGKLREPILRETHVLRALRAASASGRFYPWQPEEAFAQAPLRSPSVFNFYRPDYQPAGEIQAAGLVAPEFQITTDTYIVRTSNSLGADALWYFQGNEYADANTLLLDLAPELAFTDSPEALVDRYALWFMHGRMPAAMRSILVNHVADIRPEYNADWRFDRVRDALMLILTSPQYAVQR